MSMIHFNYIFVDSPTTHIQSSWLHPKDQQGTHYSSSKYWCDLARTLERGYFDGIFFADILSVEEEFALDIIAFGVHGRSLYEGIARPERNALIGVALIPPDFTGDDHHQVHRVALVHRRGRRHF
jgi:hypothetical protein